MKLNAARLIAAATVLFIAACATPPEQRLQDRGRVASIQHRTRMRQVIEQMGNELLTIRDTKGGIRAIVPNPYSSEMVKSGGKEYEVLYYFTNPKPKDGPVTHDELTPIVFEKGRVCGKGWEYYELLKRMSESPAADSMDSKEVKK